MSNNLSPLPIFKHHKWVAQLIKHLHGGNNRDKVLKQLNNLIIEQSSEAMRINLGFHLWNSSLTTTTLLQVNMISYSVSTCTYRVKFSNRMLCYECSIWPLIQMEERASSKVDESHGQEILHVLLDTNLFSSCLHCIRHGDTQIQKAATLMKILMQEDGLNYCCARPDEFQSLIQVLRQLVKETFTSEIPCPQHLKYVVQCYLCLSVYETVGNVFPQQLIEITFHNIIHEDPEIPEMLHQLEWNLNHRPPQ
ncbi:hypothetical protein RDI58_013574 [Solanum bulbocastanum]|uniref:Uncharacterized protein n=1 Tax=Solanum bulbocastanum TaxID=147425 RepID=A0AAN8YE42_SOLBU